MDERLTFFQPYIQREDHILELGPLHRPIIGKETYPNAAYCDIRSTEEIKALYSGNDYLKQTGLYVPVEEIVEIDYVIHGSYTQSLPNEAFDGVIASHVLEHMPNLIFSLQDIANVLKPGGTFCICYPDLRYSFDHFRTSSSFRDAYPLFLQNNQTNPEMALDFFTNAVAENEASFYWEGEGVDELLPYGTEKEAGEIFQMCMDGKVTDDVHYWPFTDRSFLKFLYDCTRFRLLPYRLTAFQATKRNCQRFMVMLKKDETVMKNPDAALQALREAISAVAPDYNNAKILDTAAKAAALEAEIAQLKDSRSWRITRPLRSVGQWMRRGRENNG